MSVRITSRSGFFYLNKAHNIHYVIFFIFKKRLDNYGTLVYTNSVVNREVIRNVVTNFDMLTHAALDEVSDSIKE